MLKLPRITVSCLLALLLLATSAWADVLVIAYMDESKVAIVDGRTFTTIVTLDTGKNPHEVRVAPDRRRAYVAAGKTVTVIDLRTNKVAANFDLGTYSAHDIRISKNGRTLWLACAQAKAVVELDALTGKVIKTYNTDREGAWFVELTPDEKKLYTPNLEGKSVSVITRATGEVKLIPFDSPVYGIDITPDGKQVWVSGRDLAVIDTATDRVIDTVKTPEAATGRIRLTPDGKKLVVALAKKIVVYDARTRRQISEVPLSAAPKVLTVSRTRAFLTNPADNSVSVVDIVSGKQVSSFPTGKKPDGISWVE